MGLTNDVFGAPIRPKKGQEPQSRLDHFYHGTTVDLSGETHLKPSAVTGHANFDYDAFYDGDVRQRSVFMHTNKDFDDDPSRTEARAWEWSRKGSLNQYGQRPTVYAVKPEGKVQRDSVGGAVMAPSARILHSIDIPPAEGAEHPLDLNSKGDEAGHVQGTLPPVNWNQFHSVQDPFERARNALQATEEAGRQKRTKTMFAKPPGYFNPGQDQGKLF